MLQSVEVKPDILQADIPQVPIVVPANNIQNTVSEQVESVSSIPLVEQTVQVKDAIVTQVNDALGKISEKLESVSGIPPVWEDEVKYPIAIPMTAVLEDGIKAPEPLLSKEVVPLAAPDEGKISTMQQEVEIKPSVVLQPIDVLKEVRENLESIPEKEIIQFPAPDERRRFSDPGIVSAALPITAIPIIPQNSETKDPVVIPAIVLRKQTTKKLEPVLRQGSIPLLAAPEQLKPILEAASLSTTKLSAIPEEVKIPADTGVVSAPTATPSEAKIPGDPVPMVATKVNTAPEVLKDLAKVVPTVLSAPIEVKPPEDPRCASAPPSMLCPKHLEYFDNMTGKGRKDKRLDQCKDNPLCLWTP